MENDSEQNILPKEDQPQKGDSFWTENKVPVTILLGSLVIALSIMWSARGLQMAGLSGRGVSGEQQRGSNAEDVQAGPAAVALSVDNLKRYANDINLNAKDFTACLDSTMVQEAVDQDVSLGQQLKVTGTPTFFINGKRIVGAQPYAEFQALIEDALAGRIKKSEQEAVPSRQGEHSIGNTQAPVTLVEFSDFECPFCGKFFSESYPRIKSNYIDSGKVKFVFKHFPLPIHPYAKKAAEASECSARQGKFWEMHDVLFTKANQK